MEKLAEAARADAILYLRLAEKEIERGGAPHVAFGLIQQAQKELFRVHGFHTIHAIEEKHRKLKEKERENP